MVPGQEEEATLAGIHAMPNTIVIDVYDNMYLGAQYWVQKILLGIKNLFLRTKFYRNID